MALILLMLPLAPASAAPRDLVSSAKAEESLASQLWQWLTSLFDTGGGSGGEVSTASTCVSTTPSRGCAIDPNGGGSY
ncbi:MAG TPA: hypothetical protein VKM72_23360 [Thermoanaerobaculia bacterium]|nr:hypothetical protein [Thermoanaerobaculia bacterium]